MRLLLLIFLLTTVLQAQWDLQPSPTTASLRGIHALGGGVAWASGTEGTVLRTTDDGLSWQRCPTPPAAEHLDFRGIQAFDANTALVMSSGKGDLSRLYKTTDGCQSWKLVFTNPDKEGFWDAVAFEHKVSYEKGGRGWLLGDPVNHQFVVFATFDGGTHWRRVPRPGLSETPHEGGAFAASHSILVPNVSPVFVTAYGWAYTGDSTCTTLTLWERPQSCLQWLSFHKQRLPIAHENDSSGVFSVGKWNNTHVAVGGDYKLPDEPASTAAFSTIGLVGWQPAQTPPHGYRSAVAYSPEAKAWITVGPNGTDLSTDDGRHWRALRPGPTEPPDADRNWNALSLPFAVGPQGRIGRLGPDALPTPAK